MHTKELAKLAIFLLVAALVIWALYLLAVGLPYTEVRQIVTGDSGSQVTITKYLPYYGAIYSVMALILVAIGVIRDKWLPLAWVGLVSHLAVGTTLIWGMGIVYIAATAVLIVPVGILQWQSSNQKRWLLVAWVGLTIVLLFGTAFFSSGYGLPILVLGILLSIWLTNLQLGHRDISPS